VSVAEAVFLGAVQGFTEFLPVSSSGHLVLVQSLMGIQQPGVFFEVMVHLGTLAAVFTVYAEDIYKMIVSVARGGRDLAEGRSSWEDFWDNPHCRLAVLIVVGSVPAAVLGLALGSAFEAMFESAATVGLMLVVTGTILWFAGGRRIGGRRVGGMTLLDAIATGTLQGCALAPGLSRSGLTISGGLFRGLDREAAARFSFLLSIPAILGAALYDTVSGGGAAAAALSSGPVLAGAATAAVCGYIAIGTVLRTLRAGSFRGFAFYCWAVGAAVGAWQIAARALGA